MAGQISCGGAVRRGGVMPGLWRSFSIAEMSHSRPGTASEIIGRYMCSGINLNEAFHKKSDS